MDRALRNTKKVKVSAATIAWRTVNVFLPLAANINERDLRVILENSGASEAEKYGAAEKLAWYRRCRVGKKVTISSLQIGGTWLVNMPGELFVQYQLWAQQLRPADHICMAAYEEYGPGYIGTRDSYGKGGYEVTELSSGTSPEVEKVLRSAMKQVLTGLIAAPQ